MNLTGHTTDTWKPHAEVVQHLQTGDWTLKINQKDLLANAKLIRSHKDRMVWESLTKVGTDWIRLRIMMKNDDSTVHFWAWAVAGDTSIDKPLLPREYLGVTSLKSSSTALSPEAYRMLGDSCVKNILHGQGRAVQYFYVNFYTKSSTSQQAKMPILEPNDYCPLDPTQTGGLWPYMGITYPVDDIARTDLYMLGGYGGYFQNTDGSWVTEEQHPDLQASQTIHAYSKDKGWINYTHPDTPWRDRMAVFHNNQDDQHMEQWCVLAQMSTLNPEDEGLQMLLEAAVHVYTRLLPKDERGTTHHEAGQERAQGRVLKTGAELFNALRVNSPKLALIAGKRAMDRWMIDRREFLQQIKATGYGFTTFGNSDFYSANEIGIHYQGLWRLHQIIEDLEFPHFEEMHWWLREASEWLFESFRFYDIQGDRRWSHPYYENADHTTPLDAPVSSVHFAWLGATHYEPKNPCEREKMRNIIALGDGIPERFKG